jgi:ferredoxin--NADP+ reductase
MFKIISKQTIAKDIARMEIYAPRVAQAALPGQFVIVCKSETSERIPLTICDHDPKQGTITLVTQIVGKSSRDICAMQSSDQIACIAGPLGKPSEWIEWSKEELLQKNMLFIAGGLGAAPVYPQVKWLAERGIMADVIIGAKNRDLIIYEHEMRAVSRNLYIATDDGSSGFHGLVTDLFRELMDKHAKNYGVMIAIGPMIMMKYAALAAKPYGMPAIVSMNTLMVDGTGMCGACRVMVGGEMRFTCVDGPEFDGHQVDFDQAMRRQKMYQQQEETAMCKCRETAEKMMLH